MVSSDIANLLHQHCINHYAAAASAVLPQPALDPATEGANSGDGKVTFYWRSILKSSAYSLQRLASRQTRQSQKNDNSKELLRTLTLVRNLYLLRTRPHAVLALRRNY